MKTCPNCENDVEKCMCVRRITVKEMQDIYNRAKRASTDAWVNSSNVAFADKIFFQELTALVNEFFGVRNG